MERDEDTSGEDAASRALEDEIAALKARVAELERAEADLRRFRVVVSAALDGIVVAASDGRILYANPAMRALTGVGDPPAHSMLDVIDPVQIPRFHAEILPALFTTGRWEGTIPHRHLSGRPWTAHMTAVTIADSAAERGHGGKRSPCIAAFLRDVSAQIQAEQERTAMQQRIIEAQREALRELSTPLVPIADQVLAMPLVGMLDRERAQQMLATLLSGIAAQRARVAILDITGVTFADSEVADGLLRAARAARLLGAEVVLTGIGPAIAQALVGLEADLSGITVRGTLQGGIAYALGRERGRR